MELNHEQERARVDDVDKAIHTLIARAALRGWTVHVIEGGFLTARWDRTRELDSLEALQRFVEQIGTGDAR